MTTATSDRTVVPAGTWKVDPVHSSVEFQVTDAQDLMATIRGRFTDFEGTLETDEDLHGARARGVVRTASVNTDQVRRDEHLRSADFLDVERYPEITFESERIERTGDDTLRIVGTLTLKDQREHVELHARILGAGQSSKGDERLLLGTQGEIDFGPMKVGLSVDVTTIRQGA